MDQRRLGGRKRYVDVTASGESKSSTHNGSLDLDMAVWCTTDSLQKHALGERLRTGVMLSQTGTGQCLDVHARTKESVVHRPVSFQSTER
jgi:hypothetical protein